jgi:hypothetical protein
LGVTDVRRKKDIKDEQDQFVLAFAAPITSEPEMRTQELMMAKGQKRSNRETKKPKQPKSQNKTTPTAPLAPERELIRLQGSRAAPRR